MKEIGAILKQLWLNKRTRAVVILMLYFFFFVFVFVFISANQKTTIPNPPLTGFEAFEKVKHYHYQITMEEKVEVIYQDVMEINYNDEKYTFQTIPTALESYYLSFWTPAHLRKIIDASTLISTNYIEHKDTYQFNTLEHPDLIPWDQAFSMDIEVYKKEDTIYKITMKQDELPFYLEWEVE